ncbi:Cupin superfamily protein [Halocaridina rubra]|uniref:Cupin superfamily protein n=1 Tax=Halocaridina rubra TaxID=373956 RepID=A0AAN8ZNL4_HALRR
MAEPVKKKLCQEDAHVRNSSKTNLINSSEIRRALLHDVKEPIVFHDYLLSDKASSECNENYWKCLQWDAPMFADLFGDQLLPFRIGPRLRDEEVLTVPQWESTCLKGKMTFSEFLEWSGGQRTCITSCGQEVHSNNYWAYFDYFYLKELKESVFLEGIIDWSLFGFSGRGTEESTLWIGSNGANTPCHIDTYGCNLVAQVLGEKRWILFPKSQSQYLSPTRIPYEESSIYSKVGFPRPCLISHPELCLSTPYVVTLKPGDVLFVPKHWWHFVENLELSVSINTWLEIPTDDEERVKEAFVMYQVGSLCHGVESVSDITSIFNPNMLDIAAMTSTELLQLLASKVLKRVDFNVDRYVLSSSNEDNELMQCKSASSDMFLSHIESSGSEVGHHFYSLSWNSMTWCAEHGIEKVPKLSYDVFLKNILGSDVKDEYEKSIKILQTRKEEKTQNLQDDTVDNSSVSLQDLEILVDTLTDYRVIEVIKQVFDEKVKKAKSTIL